MSSPYYIGVDLGGTGVKCAAINTGSGRVLRQADKPTSDGVVVDGEPAFVHAIRQLIGETESEYGRASGVGLSAPGLVALDESCIEYMAGRLDGLMGLQWGEALRRDHAVPVLNDAQAALLGEVHMGAAKGLSNVFMLTLGTGVGGAAMVDGHLLRGHIGRAGHLGHITIDYNGEGDIVKTPGSLEDAIGNATIKTRSLGHFETTHALIEAYRRGDRKAESIWLDSLKALAAGIASLINVLDPEAVIIGGGIAVAGDALFDPLGEILDQFEWRPMDHQVRLLPAELGPWAGCYGMACKVAGL